MAGWWRLVFGLTAFFAPILSLAFPYVVGTVGVYLEGQRFVELEVKCYHNKYEIYINGNYHSTGSYPAGESPQEEIVWSIMVMFLAWLFSLGTSRNYSSILLFTYAIAAIYAVAAVYAVPENIATIIASKVASNDVVSIRSSPSGGAALLALGVLAFIGQEYSES